MTDFATARRMMVDGQVRTRDVTDHSVLGAMLAVPRETFVPQEFTGVAYIDSDVPVGKDRRLLKPMLVGKLLQAAAIGPDCRVLDIGCATGYVAALLARMGAEVVALEQDGALAAQARRALADVSAKVTVVEGLLVAGWPVGAPYDVILIEGAAEVIPPELFKQLKEGGRLLAITGQAPACQATLFTVSHGVPSGRGLFDIMASRLPGFSKPPAFAF